MPYCENCGAKLSPGARFCEDCGAEVELTDSVLMEGSTNPVKSVDSLTTFEGDWLSKWSDAARDASYEEMGIILTDVESLSEQLNCSAESLKDAILDYVLAAESRGVHYHLLDCGNNGLRNVNARSVESVVGLLTEVVNVARPKYLFILGNEQIVNVAKWENQASDSDEDVPADLPYVTLDTKSPWNGQKYDFSDVLRTGRLPSYDGESLDEFVAYFEKAKEGAANITRTIPYGLSAQVWKGASDALYHEIASENVNLSPGVKLENVEQTIPDDVNLLYFNLHGSDQTKFWYGQEGSNYPEAFSPDVVASIDHPYFLGVEACYGARYIGGLTPDSSIVLMAIQKGCLALLGSSRIAFGPCVPPGTCADIMIGTFLKKISEGESSGDAYCAAMDDLMSDGNLNDSTIKTLAEFSLYGDPSVGMGRYKAKSKIKKLLSGVSKGLRVPMPDIRRALAAVQLASEHRAAQIFRNMIYSQGKSLTSKLSFSMMDYMQGIDPKFYQVGDTGLYQAVFVNNKGPFSRIAKVYFDAKGAIKQQLVSK